MYSNFIESVFAMLHEARMWCILDSRAVSHGSLIFYQMACSPLNGTKIPYETMFKYPSQYSMFWTFMGERIHSSCISGKPPD